MNAIVKNAAAKIDTKLPVKGTPKEMIAAALAKGKATAPKGKGTAIAAPTTEKAKINPLVLLDLPKGTERFTSASGIDWIRTPKHGAFQRWFNMTRGKNVTGIHAAAQNKDGSFTLTIERARLPHRRDGEKNVGTLREMK